MRHNAIDVKQKNALHIELYDKLALPLTTIALVLIGVPLAITPPRVRYNRGFLFSILIIFAYYLIRALSISFGEAGTLQPFLAAWMPNIVLTWQVQYCITKKFTQSNRSVAAPPNTAYDFAWSAYNDIQKFY